MKIGSSDIHHTSLTSNRTALSLNTLFVHFSEYMAAQYHLFGSHRKGWLLVTFLSARQKVCN